MQASADVTGVDLERDPAGGWYRKRPLPVAVEFAAMAGTVQTLEGAVRYDAHDALLTGVEGERWPVARARFDATYVAVAPTQPGEAGRYLKHPQRVRARRMDAAFCVRIRGGDVLSGGAGDWLLQYAPGEHGIVLARVFAATYDAAP